MTPQTIRLARREDLICYVPYLLGFHPADSIVLMAMSGHQIDLSARADADQPTRELIRQFCQALKQLRRVTGIFLVGYGPDVIAGPTRTVADALRSRGYAVHEALRVHDGRFHCLQCDGCTAPDGVAFDVNTSPAAAAATYAGMVARPNREAVEKLVKPIGGLAAIAMNQAVDRAEDRLATLRSSKEVVDEGKRVVDEALRRAKAGERLDDDEVAWLSVLLADVAVRDHAWHLTDGDDWQLEFWLDMNRRAESVLAAPMATMVAWCAWRQGDGGAPDDGRPATGAADRPGVLLGTAALRHRVPVPPANSGERIGSRRGHHLCA